MTIIRVTLMMLLLLTIVVGVGAVSAQGEDYHVRYADTIDEIAQSFNASVACIVDANELPNPNVLEFGQLLTIPADCGPYDPIESVVISNRVNQPDAADEADSDGQGGGAITGDYRVRYGDTLDVIAQEADVSIVCLVDANDLTNVNALDFGQELTIPADCDPYDAIESIIISNLVTGETAADDDGQGGGAITGDYRVRYGDTLDVIAQEADVSLACLIEANGLANANDLSFAQILVIPDDCPAYDAMESIVLSNIDDLETAGFAGSDDSGQGGGGADSSDSSVLSGCAGDRHAGRVVSNGVYTVRQGDTLDFIGCDLNMSTTCLIALNDLKQKGGDLAIGQQLTIGGQCAGWEGA